MISLLILSNRVKKIASKVDNCPVVSEKRYKMIFQIQKFLKEGCSYRESSKRMGVPRILRLHHPRQNRTRPARRRP